MSIGSAAVIAFGWALATAPPVSLEQALEHERALLQREKDGLASALRSQEAAAETTRAALRAEIEALAAELARVQADNAARELRLPQIEQTRADHAQHRHLVDLVDETNVWLRQHDLPAAQATGPAALPENFAAILRKIEHDGALRVEHGRYFDADGIAREGDILHVGRVAAVPDGAPEVPLVHTPAGLQVVSGVTPLREPQGAALRVRVVLHDPSDPPDPRAYAASTWAEQMDAGGSLMWVLLAFAVLAVILTAERAVMLAWAAMRWRNLDRAAKRDEITVTGPAWLAAPLVRLVSGRELPPDVLEDRLARDVLVVRDRLFRRLSLLGVVAAVAPLLGLLGTVSGMITTFSVVTTKGTDDPQLLAGGISQALLTTEFGLAVAIPVVVVHAVLSRVARRLVARIEHRLLAILHAGGGDD